MTRRPRLTGDAVDAVLVGAAVLLVLIGPLMLWGLQRAHGALRHQPMFIDPPLPRSLLEFVQGRLRGAGWSEAWLLAAGDVLVILALLALAEFCVILLLARRLARPTRLHKNP